MKTLLLLLRLLILQLLLGSTFSAYADWINLTGAETSPNIAEIYVHDDHVKVKLEVYIGDLTIFDDLVPDSWIKDLDSKRLSLESRLERFASTSLKIVTANGDTLPVKLALVEPRMRVDRRSPFAGMINPYTRQRVPMGPEDKRVLYAELIYPFKGKPESLEITPPLDEEGRAKASIGFIAYHKSVPVIDFRYLGAPAQLNLNWSDPWYSKFDNPNLKRHHKSALMSYLYIEPHEVRHEVLTRVKDLETWMDLELRGKEYIEIDELDGLKQRIGAFLLKKNPLLVDGEALKPILDRTSFVTVSINGIQLVEQPQRLEISTAIVGVIITYLTPGIPQKVTVDWELFSDKIQRVPATATDPAGPLPTYLTPDDATHVWTNFLKNYVPPTVAPVVLTDTLDPIKLPLGSILALVALLPVGWWLRSCRKNGQPIRSPLMVSFVLVIAAGVLYPHARISANKPAALLTHLSENEASEILNALLKNVYRSFDFRDESDVYDKLALSVSGDLLTNIYLQNRKSFAVKKAGGAQARVKQIEILDVQSVPHPEKPRSFVLNTQWTAMGTVGHWGHVHTRKNFYDAAVTVEAIDGVWKIIGLELLEEKRIDPFANQDKKAS